MNKMNDGARWDCSRNTMIVSAVIMTLMLVTVLAFGGRWPLFVFGVLNSALYSWSVAARRRTGSEPKMPDVAPHIADEIAARQAAAEKRSR